MPKVAESTLATLAHLKLTATSLTEVSNWTKVTVDGAEHVPTIIKVLSSFHCVLLLAKLDVNIAPQMVTLIVTHTHLFNLSILFFTLKEYIFKEILKLFLDLMVTHIGEMGSIRTFG